jgi:hypothetical protein
MRIKHLLAVGAAATVMVGTATPAHAADPVETFKNLHTGLCLGDNSGFPWTWRCAGTASQHWSVHHWADGTVRLQNVSSGSCVADVNGGLWSRLCTTGQNESWWVKHYSDGSLRFQNQATGLCIEDSATNGLERASCNDTTAERWS